jgi:hypothetical protein
MLLVLSEFIIILFCYRNITYVMTKVKSSIKMITWATITRLHELDFCVGQSAEERRDETNTQLNCENGRNSKSSYEPS